MCLWVIVHHALQPKLSGVAEAPFKVNRSSFSPLEDDAPSSTLPVLIVNRTTFELANAIASACSAFEVLDEKPLVNCEANWGCNNAFYHHVLVG